MPPLRKLRRRLVRRWTEIKPRIKKIKRRVRKFFRIKRSAARAAAMSGVPAPLPASALKTIRFSLPSDPLVSIIVPVYGKCDYTLRCLASIAARCPASPFEIIVIDDCSPDGSAERLRRIEGVRLIQNASNQGFIRSCNIGARAARGQYLCFLNNDTEVAQAWLDELARTFREFPGTGLVGSKLIYPAGSLQEAGGILWRDGSAWNFGRLKDPSSPTYNYAREVDYCSGASIMVPKELFDELGGFDELYLPAYGEDSDLALKIRSHGRRVIYQPLSVVVHHEGVTSGTNVTAGVKSHQIDNAAKLFERWKDRLRHHQEPGVDVDRAKDRRAKYRVLVLDHCTPMPNQDAGSITVFNLLLLLRELDFQTTFIPEDNFVYMPRYTPELQRVGIEVLYAPYVTSVEQHLRDSGGKYDLVFVFRPRVMVRHIEAIRRHCPHAKILYHTVDLHFLRMAREALLLGDQKGHAIAGKMKEQELAAIRAADGSIVHSPAELELLRLDLVEERIHVFPLIMDIRGTTKAPSERHDVVFVGGYQHPPNVDAVRYFVSEMMPLLRRRLPGIRFFIVGSRPPADVMALASDEVIVTGFVDDLSALLDRMRVAVAPLRYGAGVKGKIGTTMAVGLPCVATSMAVEGMSLTDGENILVADDPASFAAAIIRLYESEWLWNDLSKAGLQFATENWSAGTAWRRLRAVLGDLGFVMEHRRYPLTLYAPNDGESGETPRGSNYRE